MHATEEQRRSSREDEWLQSSCSGKHPYDNPTIAHRARRHSRYPDLVVYRCKYCGKWHIGQGNRPVKMIPHDKKRPARKQVR